MAGATYVSVFVGRLDDAGHDGMQVVQEAIEIFDNYPELDAQVIAASIRHPLHCAKAAQIGADVLTIPYNVLMQMIQHPFTTAGIKKFLDDWKSVSK
jgi:transaldolase